MDFTVVIPTYNGAERLPRVLDALSNQTNLEGITGEIIIVDNNSTDQTAQVIKKYQEIWNFPFALKYDFEPQQGTSFARKKGVEIAKGEIIGFLDDDNLPAENWIYTAYQFSQSYPQAGAYGGKIIGEFETPPPENFEKIAQFLAIRDYGEKPYPFEPKQLRLPTSAGLIVRKQAWCQSVPSHCLLTGPQGTKRLAGEDYEVLLYIYKQGWEIWYNPEMRINHVIPSQRLTRAYLLPLAKGIGLVTCQLRMILVKNWEKPIICLRTLLGNLKRLLFHCLKYKFTIQQDLVASFEFQFYWGSFLSPFYYLHQIVKSQIFK